MATIASDNFNRADNPTSLGTATTGQVWVLVPGEGHVLPGDPYGIESNQARWNRNGTGASGDGLTAIETGFSGAKVSVKLMDVLAGGSSNLRNMGILFRYVDATHYMFATYARAGGGLWRLYVADGSSPIHRGPDSSAAPVNGDTMTVTFCGQVVSILLNGVVAEGYPLNFADGHHLPLSPTLLAGTQCGLQSSGGVISSPPYQLFDDFLVETNGTCTPTYNCTGGACVDPGDGTGTYATLAECLAGCSVAVSYNCVNGQCVDPGNGSGTFATLLACQNSGCGIPSASGPETMEFDTGIGSEWYLVPPIVDSGMETRSKTIKSVRVTGKITNASAQIYGYDVSDPIVTDDLESGTNASVTVALSDTTQVAQSPREQVNIPNSVLWTSRIEGNDINEDTRDRVDEIAVEASEIGVRR